MPNDIKQTLKHLLQVTDPDSLKQLMPECTAQQVAELIPLLQQHRNLDEQVKQRQDVSRALSRQIGEAKKQGSAIDPLLTEMRSNSEALKKLSEDIQVSESQIQACLNIEPGSTPTAKQPSTKSSTARHYRDAQCDQPLRISRLEEDISQWNRYVENHPAATLYHLAQWRDVIRQSFGHEAVYLYAHDEHGRVKGVLPLIRLKSRLFGDFLVSVPYFNYGGAIGDHPEIENALIEEANRHAAHLGLSHIEYRDDIAKPNTPERTDKVNMILSLPGDEDTLWQSFSPKLRSQIKRPQREDTRVVLGGQELLDDFYRVFARNMRDLGTPVYGKAFFANILRTFVDTARILIVYLGNKPVAGAFLIGYKERLEIPWASTVRSANHLSVNMLMYWEVLRFAIRQHYTYFDFGRSSLDSGTYKFKKQWGAQPKQLYWHYWLNNREMPSLNPSNPKYKLMINVWKRMPIWLTKAIGPMIVKNLP